MNDLAASMAEEAPVFGVDPEDFMEPDPLLFEDEIAMRRELSDLEEALVIRARHDPSVFAEFVMKDEETGNRITLMPMHREWQALVSTYKRTMIFSHVESGKSFLLSVARVLWEIGRNPNIRVVIVMNTDAQAQKICKTIAKYILEDPDYQRVFPHIKRGGRGGDSWTANQLTVERKTIAKDPTLRTVGVQGNILGARIDLLVIDDVLDYENTYTDHQRNKLEEWFNSTMEGRIREHGRLICVGTAWHQDDLMHRWARRGDWFCRRYSVLNDDGTASWPERWPLTRIEEKRVIGPIEFNRQLMCVARSDEESRFKSKWITDALARGEGRPATYALESIPPGFSCYTGCDVGVKKKKGADLSVLFTILIYPNGDREVLEVASGNWGGPELVRRIIDVNHRFGSIVIVESNACFVGGTPVLTDKGYKPIESIFEGDMVWTHKGRWRPVTGTIKGKSELLCKAKAKGALPVVGTPNHWFYMREAGRTPGRKGGHHRPVGDDRWVSYGFRDKKAYAALALPKWPAAPAVLRLGRTNRAPARDVPVDDDIALLLGLYMAEGHSTLGQVFWTLNENELHIAEFIKRTVQRLVPGKVTFRYNNGTLRVVVSSTQLANAFRFGKSDTKCLPIEWLGWPLEVRLALVRGWLVGDGSMQTNNQKAKNPTRFLQGPTISRNWAMFARATLADAGILSGLSATHRESSEIEGRKVRRKKMYVLRMTQDGTVELKKHMVSAIEKTRWHHAIPSKVRASGGGMVRDGVHAWSYVPDVEDAPYTYEPHDVFNLTVEEDESYTVEDFIVHNAQDFVLQFANEQSDVPVLPFNTGLNKSNPEFGVESIGVEFANGKWIIPAKGGLPANKELSVWIQEMLYYDPDAHTGDRLMASWFAREGSRIPPKKRGRTKKLDVLSR